MGTLTMTHKPGRGEDHAGDSFVSMSVLWYVMLSPRQFCWIAGYNGISVVPIRNRRQRLLNVEFAYVRVQPDRQQTMVDRITNCNFYLS